MGAEMMLGVAAVEVMRLKYQQDNAGSGSGDGTLGEERKPVARLAKAIAERLRIGVYGLRSSGSVTVSGQA
jgi:hypothetical protein